MMKPRTRMNHDLMQRIQARTNQLNYQQKDIFEFTSQFHDEFNINSSETNNSNNNEKSTKNTNNVEKTQNQSKSKLYYEKNLDRCNKPIQNAQKSCVSMKKRMLEACSAQFLGNILCPAGDFLYGKECDVESLVSKKAKNSPQICNHYLNESEFDGLDENAEHLNTLNEQFSGNVSVEFSDFDAIDLPKHKLLNKDSILKLQVLKK
jgi:hypothetical protein